MYKLSRYINEALVKTHIDFKDKILLVCPAGKVYLYFEKEYGDRMIIPKDDSMCYTLWYLYQHEWKQIYKGLSDNELTKINFVMQLPSEYTIEEFIKGRINGTIDDSFINKEVIY